MHDLQSDMRYVKGKLGKLDTTINGPDDSPHPSGIKYEVGQNTRFRLNVTKFLWMLGSAVIGIITYLITHGGAK